MYKGKKYNVIVVLLIFIISAVVGVSAGMSPGVSPDNSLAPETEIPVTDQESELPSGLTPPSATASPMRKLSFALDILNNGAGYRSRSTQTLTIEALGFSQYMNFQKHRGGGLNLSQEWFKFSAGGIFASAGKNEYRSTFSDGKTMYEKVVQDRSKFNFDTKSIDYSAQGTVNSQLVSDYEGAQNRLPLNDFFIPIDNKSVPTSQNIYENKRISTEYTLITVNINIGGVSPKYLATFTANGGGEVQLDKIELKFYISKATGMLLRVQKNERFKATYAGFASSWCTTILEETYEAMNSSQEETIRKIAKDSYGLVV